MPGTARHLPRGLFPLHVVLSLCPYSIKMLPWTPSNLNVNSSFVSPIKPYSNMEQLYYTHHELLLVSRLRFVGVGLTSLARTQRDGVTSFANFLGRPRERCCLRGHSTEQGVEVIQSTFVRRHRCSCRQSAYSTRMDGVVATSE